MYFKLPLLSNQNKYTPQKGETTIIKITQVKIKTRKVLNHLLIIECLVFGKDILHVVSLEALPQFSVRDGVASLYP